MLTVRYTENFRIEKPCILTIGTFDGVHLGHQKILKRLNEVKQKTGLNSTILTFDPHPRKVLFPEQKDLKLITTTDEKLALLEQNSIDITIVYPFSKAFAQMDPQAYIRDILIKSLRVKYLIIGYDHKFGKNRDGDIKTLKNYSKEFNYEVEEISVHDINHINVSSSKIREALNKGEIELANKYLGQEFFITALVVKGKQLGRTLGYPTANLEIDDEDKMIPAIGVYLVNVLIDHKEFYGMLSIGKNPTTDTDELVKIEVNIFNFDKDIYNNTVRVSFMKRLRDEVKFETIELLKTQLKHDKENCLKLIEELNQHA
ncbi:MAG: bifunctional riboflavin kinase/FAD synthetase [Sphingobacteriaceae bacterium]|nr:bifunctional riboflavin kinase/FAD synthetase [Sphingobacteriaceae bacterium]